MASQCRFQWRPRGAEGLIQGMRWCTALIPFSGPSQSFLHTAKDVGSQQQSAKPLSGDCSESAAGPGHASSGYNPPSVTVSAWVQRPGLACKATWPCGSRAPRGTDQGLCWGAGPCSVAPPSAHLTLPQTCSRQHTHHLLQARLCLRGFFLGT